jgi:hypothetical protein
MFNNLLESVTLGNILSLAANILALIGIALTYREARKSKTAAQQANDAVRKARDDIRKGNTLAQIAEALTIMEEIKREQRAKVWDLLPERYSTLCGKLSFIQGANLQLTKNNKTILTGAITQFRFTEKQIDTALFSGRHGDTEVPLDVARLNEHLSEQSDKVGRILIEIQTSIGD